MNAIQVKLESIKIQPDEVNVKKLEYEPLPFIKDEDMLYLQGQRQNIIQNLKRTILQATAVASPKS